MAIGIWLREGWRTSTLEYGAPHCPLLALLFRGLFPFLAPNSVSVWVASNRKQKLNWLRWNSSYMIWKLQIAFQRFKVLGPGLTGALCVSMPHLTLSFLRRLLSCVDLSAGLKWLQRIQGSRWCPVLSRAREASPRPSQRSREIGHCGQGDPIMLMTLLAHLWNCSLDQSRQTTSAAWSGKRGRGRGALSLQVLPGHHPERRETAL